MPVDTDGICEILRKLAEEEKLQVTVKECVKSGAFIGGASILGGLVLGPPGLAIGATVAGCASACNAKNKFSSVVQILRDMDPGKKRELAEKVRHIWDGIDVTDMGVLAGLLANNETVRRRVITELIEFVNHEMTIAIANKT